MKTLYVIGRLLLAFIVLYGVYLETGPFNTAALFILVLAHDISTSNLHYVKKTLDNHLLTGRKS